MKTYIEQIAKSTLLKSPVAVEVRGIGEGPRKLLTYANQALKGNARKFPNKADMVFLIFDKDQHDGFEATLEQAKNHNKVHVFASTPCIEIFFILHYQYCSLPANCYSDLSGILQAIPELKKYNKGSGSVPVASMLELQNTAITNAERLRTERRKTDSDNPMTDMDVFIDFLEKIKLNGLTTITGNNDPRFLHNDP